MNNKISKVLIHDAARPNFSLKLIFNLLKNLKKNKCVVPVLKTNSSVKVKEKNKLKNVDRNKIYLTQTPQAFDYQTLLKLQKKTTSKITDDANNALDDDLESIIKLKEETDSWLIEKLKNNDNYEELRADIEELKERVSKLENIIKNLTRAFD